MNEAYNIDCMEFMRRVPSKYFDLAVVDPPYGIEKGFKATSRVRRYGQTKTANDDKPTAEYFTELFRVSKNQIIWGYNHLSDLLPPTKEFIFWYKRQPVDSYSDGELAWTSFNKTANALTMRISGTSARMTCGFIPCKSRLRCICGFSRNTRIRTTRFLIHTLGAGQAELPLTIWRLISSGARSTQIIFRSKNNVLKNIQRSSGYSYDRRKEGTSW